MKKLSLLVATIALFTISNQVSAQSAKKTVKQEITLEEENGVKTLKIVTTEKAGTKTEMYKGADADAKIAEIEKKGTISKTVMVAPDGRQYVKIEQKQATSSK